jgi:DNA-3-methyladenine glycosylase I
MIMPERCFWADSSPHMLVYHDEEWGTPQHDDRLLFELLILEGAQAGLSWETVLRKRDAYRMAFDGFDFEAIAHYDERKRAELLANPGIIRNARKIDAAVTNAQAFLRVREELGSFDAYVWGFIGGKAIQNAWRTRDDLPATSRESDALSRDLKRRGFSFVGSTICYAYMQAVGMVNDHMMTCYRWAELKPSG